MKYVLSTLLAVIILALIFIGATPMGRAMINNYGFTMQKVDDATNYDTIRQVEDTARGMIASYNSDKLRYEQYKVSTDKTQIEWGEQAKMRANTTASTYNNYILKNKFVWKDNVPTDIFYELPYLD